MSLFQKLQSPEKRALKTIEDQKNYGITGEYKKRYSFVLDQKQWMAPGFTTIHKIKGNFDCGLDKINLKSGTQTWSIEIRDLEFDWNPNALPETYFLFAYPYRMDIQIDILGKLIAGNTWVDYKENWKKKYRKELYDRIEDKKRADNLYSLIYSGCPGQHKLAVELLKINPLITTLGNVVALNNKINHDKDGIKGEFGERFTGEVTKEDYFSPGIYLPLKTTWLEKATTDELIEEWVHIGGLLEEKYQAEEFRRLMRTTTGIFNLEVPVHVDFSEFYELSKPAENFRQIIKCGLRTETVIKDVWIKSENLEMYEEERGIVYE